VQVTLSAAVCKHLFATACTSPYLPFSHCTSNLRTHNLSQVYKGRRKCTGQITAMKFIMKHGKSEKDIKNLRQEIEILRQLRHENIIQMLDSFETKTDFCVVTGEEGMQAQNCDACIP